MSRCARTSARAIAAVMFVCAWTTAALAAEEVDATLHWSRRVVLGVPVTGVVSEVRAAVGDRVEKNQILLVLDPRGFENRVAESRAEMQLLAPALEEARRELERAEDLYDRTLLADHDLQLAEIAVAELEARERAAAAKLARSELRLERSVLRAPFDGVVVGVDAEVGETVVSRCAAAPLVTLADDAYLLARAVLPARRLGSLVRGQEIAVVLEGERLSGRVHALGLEPVGSAEDGPRYALDVLLAPPSTELPRAGRRVTLVLP